MNRIYLLFLLLFLFFSKLHSQEDTSVIVCKHSLEMLEWDLEFLNEAKQTIEFGAYYTGGVVFFKIMSKIKERLEICPQLQAYVLASPNLLRTPEWQLIQEVESSFPDRFHLQLTGNVLVFSPDMATIEDHMKFLIVDEKYFSVGGTNFDDALCSEGTFTPPRLEDEAGCRAYMPSGVRDQDVVGRGPIAKDIRIMFYKLFALWEHYFKTCELIPNPEFFKNASRYFPIEESEKCEVLVFESSSHLIKNPKVQMAYSGPMDAPNKILTHYVHLIDQAKEEIFIGNLYFMPPEPIFQALIKAAERGVKISVITNGLQEGHPFYGHFIGWGSRIHYLPLFFGREYKIWEKRLVKIADIKKTEIYEFAVRDVLYHKKTMVVDRQFSIVGSYNLGNKSNLNDYEIILILDSKSVASNILKVLEIDKKLSIKISPNDAIQWYFDPLVLFAANYQRKLNGFF